MARPWTAVAAVLCCLLAASASAGEIGADNFSASLTLTTDYVYRGVSQTAGDPAVQGGFDFTHDVGFFAGLWVSNVDFETTPPRQEPRDLEIDYYIGYVRQLGRDWTGRATLLRYTYPGSDPDFHYDYNELLLDVTFRDWVTAGVGYTNDIFGTDTAAVSYELSGRYPVAGNVDLNAGAGLFDLDDLFEESYAFWNVGVSVLVSRFTFDLGYFDTDSTAERIFGEAAGDRVVLSVSATIQ